VSKINSENVSFGNSVLVGLPGDGIKQDGEGHIFNEARAKAEEEANKIIQNAMAQAQKIMTEAQAELNACQVQAATLVEEARKKGEEEGFQQGYEKGGEKIAKELSAEVAKKIAAVDLFAGSNFEIKKKIIKSAHSEVVGLTLAIAKKVCHKILDKDAVFKIVEGALSALEKSTENEKINIIISPHLAEMAWEELQGLKNAGIVVNAKIAQDAIIVESLSERADCSISSQLDKIVDEFAQELGKTHIE
jgi:flagellar assembly protein FliH